MRIRRDQISLLAKANNGRHLAEEFTRAGTQASFDSSEGSVTVCDPGADKPSRLLLDGEGRVTKVVTPMGREYGFEFLASSTKVSTPSGRHALLNLDSKRRDPGAVMVCSLPYSSCSKPIWRPSRSVKPLSR